jgi:hypothetical protein
MIIFVSRVLYGMAWQTLAYSAWPPGAYSQHFIFIVNHKLILEYYITLGGKGLPGSNALVYWGLSVSYEENEVL